MTHRSELTRRKDNCVECKDYKPIKAKNMCQNCWHKFKRKNEPNFFLRTRYTELVQRCKGRKGSHNDKYYKGLTYCTREEFLDKFLKSIEFNKLFENWKDNNFLYTLCPSIDRIDKNKGYILNNIQFITHGENCSKDNDNRVSVSVYNKYSGNHLGDFQSLNLAVKHFDVQQSNAWKVLYGKRSHTEGLIFKLKT